MSVATGGVDSVRLHSVTQRAEYVGEVLRKVQAVGETPQGGQVRKDTHSDHPGFCCSLLGVCWQSWLSRPLAQSAAQLLFSRHSMCTACLIMFQ